MELHIHVVRAVIKRWRLGIFTGYFQLFSQESRRKIEPKGTPSCLILLCNKTISKRTPLHKENPFPQFSVAGYKHPGVRLSFEYTTSLLSGEGGEGRTGTAAIHGFGLFSCYSQISQLIYLLDQF